MATTVVALSFTKFLSIVPRGSRLNLSETVATAIVVGEVRASDGLTFGEFAKLRYIRTTCRGAAPDAFEFRSSPGGSNREPTFQVLMSYRDRSLPECPLVGKFEEIATVTARDGVLPSRAGAALLKQFRAGRAP